MPKKRKTSLLDFDTSKPFSEMSLKIISSENLVSLKQIYGDDFFNKLIKGKTYITFENIGFSPLVLMALYDQHYSLTFSNRLLRG